MYYYTGRGKLGFFIFFAMGSKDGKGPRDIQSIRSTVPIEYQLQFDAGARGEISL